MNLTKLLCLSVISFSMSSFADTTIVNKSDLYGSWQCDHDFSEPQKNIKIKLNYSINLMKNGTSAGNADLLFSMGGMPELKYKEVDTALWSLEGNQLKFVSNNIQFINVSHPELEQLLNLQQLFPKRVNESVKVLGLSKKYIKIQSQQHNDVYTCLKF